MRKLFVLTLVPVLMSCCKDPANKVTVANDFQSPMDSVVVYGNQKCSPLVLRDIMPSRSVVGYLKNCNVEAGDGSYVVEVYFDAKVLKKGFGYYTNGWMHFEKLEIVIGEDGSVLLDPK